MEGLYLERNYFSPTATMGKLYVNGVYVCETLELPSSGLNSSARADYIRELKQKQKICIPSGIYLINRTYSPRFKKTLPEVLGVPGFSGIRIHTGNSTKDTEGCILVGLARRGEKVINSRTAFAKLINLWNANYGDTITEIKIVEKRLSSLSARLRK